MPKDPITVNPGADGVTEVSLDLGQEVKMKYQNGYLIFTFKRNLERVKLTYFSPEGGYYVPDSDRAVVAFSLGTPQPE